MNLIKYLKEVKAELKEVKFPSGNQTLTYTILVIFISTIIALALSGIDLGLKEALTKIINR